MGPSARVANKNTGFTSLASSWIQLCDNAEYCCSIFISLNLVLWGSPSYKDDWHEFIRVSKCLSCFFLSSLSTHCPNPTFPVLPVSLVCYIFLPLYQIPSKYLHVFCKIPFGCHIFFNINNFYFICSEA